MTITIKNGSTHLIIAAGIFILRFIPLYKLDMGMLGASRFSLSELSDLCSLPLIGLMDGCKIINVINPVYWLVLIGLVCWAIYEMVDK